MSPFVALPQSLPLNASKVALGNQLFNEVRLSRDATISSAHCHRFDMGGVDRRPVSRGVGVRKAAPMPPQFLTVALISGNFGTVGPKRWKTK
ncbi:MAG: hypothetical protein IPG42_20320 [Betaproteobacteria bacterium]|nr:hypothetical protein [Betaproteobacteria bacterium]